jgi:hypothetical protein
MPRWVFSLVQFFPLSLFASYAFWRGAPTNERWVEAFQIAAVAGIVQLAIVLPQRLPVNRLVLAGNIYLILGGLAALAQQWWYLQLYGQLRESAIFMVMLVVGVVATFATSPGFIAAADAEPAQARRYSIALLAATVLCLIPALAFEGNRLWSAVVPIIALALFQRHLAGLANRQARGAVG